jgi:hypothetical protein
LWATASWFFWSISNIPFTFQHFWLTIQHFYCQCHRFSSTPNEELATDWPLQNSTTSMAGPFLNRRWVRCVELTLSLVFKRNRSRALGCIRL